FPALASALRAFFMAFLSPVRRTARSSMSFGGLDRGQGGRGVRCELAGALGRLGAVGLELVGPLMDLIVGTIGQSLDLGTSLLSELFGLAGQRLNLWACPVRSLAQLGRRGLAGIGQDSE